MEINYNRKQNILKLIMSTQLFSLYLYKWLKTKQKTLRYAAVAGK